MLTYWLTGSKTNKVGSKTSLVEQIDQNNEVATQTKEQLKADDMFDLIQDIQDQQ
jgi:hypothetical protein